MSTYPMNTKHSTTAKLVDLIHTHTSDSRQNQLLGVIALPGFDTAPASSRVRYHHAYEGGLVDHIVEIFEIGEKVIPTSTINQTRIGEKILLPPITKGSFLTCAILHDLAKIGDAKGNPYYVPNILKSGKQSTAEPYEVDNEKCRVFTDLSNPEAETLLEYADFSDGEASLALVKAKFPDLYDNLTSDEIYAIRFHDGGYGKVKYARKASGMENALQITLHWADMLSSRARNWNNELTE
jgi:hypothetical protein